MPFQIGIDLHLPKNKKQKNKPVQLVILTHKIFKLYPEGSNKQIALEAEPVRKICIQATKRVFFMVSALWLQENIVSIC